MTDARTQKLIDDWCADPEMWGTHGMPGDNKLYRLAKDIDTLLASNPTGKVAGYTAQPDAKVALVNEFKADEERLLRKLDALLAKQGNLSPGQVAHGQATVDPRWLAIGRTQLQEAFMSINRAIFQPQRIRLPEDE